MIRTFILATSLVLAAIPASAQRGQVSATTSAAIDQVIRDFASNLYSAHPYSDDVDKVFGVRDYNGPEARQWSDYWSKTNPARHIEIGNIEIRDFNAATAKARVSYAVIDDRQKNSALTTVENLSFQVGEAISANGTLVWQIVPLPVKTVADLKAIGVDLTPGRTGLVQKPVELPVLNAVAGAIADPVKAWGTQQSLPSQTRLTQLGWAAMTYTDFEKNKFEFAPAKYPAALKTKKPFGDLSMIPGTDEIYSFNGNLQGHRNPWAEQDVHLGTTTESIVGAPPSRLILFYEGKNQVLNFRYGGQALVLFVDGTVALITPEEVNTLIWKP